VLALLNNTRQTTMAACFAACPADSCCMMQYDVTNKTCRIGSLPPVAFNASVSAGMQLLYKLPPSTMGSASSVELAPPTDVTQPTVITVGEDGTGTVAAKTIASGYYATCSIPAASAAVWQTAGTNLGPDARTFAGGPAAWDTSSTSRAQCERKCDESNVCWGVVYNAATGACLYRGGVDALATRSFFVMPVTGLQGNVSQQCPAVAPVSLDVCVDTESVFVQVVCVSSRCAFEDTRIRIAKTHMYTTSVQPWQQRFVSDALSILHHAYSTGLYSQLQANKDCITPNAAGC
jgi:hypothetical protein